MQIIPRQPNLRAALLLTLLAAPLTLWALAVGLDRAVPQAPAASEATRVERQPLTAPPVSPSASKLMVLHWDIFMTPPPVGYLDAPTCRAAAIADQIEQASDPGISTSSKVRTCPGSTRSSAGLRSRGRPRPARRPRSPVCRRSLHRSIKWALIGVVGRAVAAAGRANVTNAAEGC